jgi:pSer/pThr/pTyr-binding forkhead associated (FHA) protein
MVICSNCQSKQLDGAIFCLECGASMLSAGGLETTRPLDSGGTSTAVTAEQARAPGKMVEPSLTLVVVASRRRLTLDLAEELLIGRADAGRGIHPDVDLGLDGGYDAGVSRRHAILSYRDGACVVEDLGSANGTFVNGRRVSPHAAVPLANGDELTCGTLALLVELA